MTLGFPWPSWWPTERQKAPGSVQRLHPARFHAVDWLPWHRRRPARFGEFFHWSPGGKIWTSPWGVIKKFESEKWSYDKMKARSSHIACSSRVDPGKPMFAGATKMALLTRGNQHPFVKSCDLQMQRHGFDLIIPGCFGKLVLFLYVLALVALDNDVRGMADGVHVLQVPWICWKDPQN